MELINGRTIENIKLRLICCFKGGMCGACPDRDDRKCMEKLNADTIALIEHLEAERDAALAKVPKWISVKEQPNPPEDGEYWCYGYWIRTGRKQMEEAEYLGGEWKIVNNFVLTHWMPMPNPPKEDA